jgi:hypothetical protein
LPLHLPRLFPRHHRRCLERTIAGRQGPTRFYSGDMCSSLFGIE